MESPEPKTDDTTSCQGITLRGMTWDDPRGYGPLEAVSRAFAQTEMGCGTTIEWDIQPLTGFESHPLPDLAERYDLIVMDHPHVGEAVATGCLLPFEDLPDEYLGPSLNSYRMQDAYWAVPIDAACQVAAYLPVRLSDVPTRFEGVFELAGQGLRIGASLTGVHSLMALMTLLAQSGHPVPSDRDNGLPSADVVQRAADLLLRIQRILTGPALTWNPLELLAAMNAGDCDYAVFTFSYVNFQRQGVRFTQVPTWVDGPSRGAVIGGTGMAVSSNTHFPKVAQAYARFVGSEKVQTDLWPRYGGQPAHRRAWEQLAKFDPFYRDLKLGIETATIRPRFAGWNRLQTQAGNMICHWLGEKNAQPTELDRQLRKLWNQKATGS